MLSVTGYDIVELAREGERTVRIHVYRGWVVALLLVMTAGIASAQTNVTLTFWTFVADHAAFYERMAEAFNEAQSEYRLTLQTTTMPVDQMHDNLLISLLAGVGAPDIVDVNIQYAGLFFKQNPEYFVDLTPLVEPYRDVMNPERIKVYTDTNGRILGLPTHLGAGLAYYYRPPFEDAGIDIDDIQYYDDWVAAGKKVTRPDQNVYMTAVQNRLAREFLLFTMQKGGYMVDPQGNVTVDGPKAVEALQFIYDLVHEHKIAMIAPGGTVNEPPFFDAVNRGQVLSLAYAQWYMIRYKSFMPDLAGHVYIRPLPLWEPGGFTSATMGGTGTAILASARNVEAAKKFLEFAKLTYEGNVRIWTDLGFDPPRMDVYDDPRLLEPDPYFGNESIMLAVKKAAERIVAKPVSPLSSEIMTILNRDTLFNVLNGTQTPKEALEALARQFR